MPEGRPPLPFGRWARTRWACRTLHDFGIQAVVRNGIQNDPFGKELGVHIAVVQELPEVQFALGKQRYSLAVLAIKPDLAHRRCGYMYEPCSCSQAELHATFGTTDIHLLYIVGFGEVLDIGSAVEYSLNG